MTTPLLVCAATYREALALMGRERDRNSWRYVAFIDSLIGVSEPEFVITDAFWDRPDALAIWERLKIVRANEVRP